MQAKGSPESANRRKGERRIHERRSDVHDSSEWLRLLIENVIDYAMFTTDCKGIIRTWNPGAEHIFGYNENEIIGQPAAIVFTPEDREQHIPEEEMQTALKTGRALDERWHIRRDGSRFYASGILTSLHHEDGTVHGFAKIVRDLTERKQADEALHQAHEELHQAHQQLEDRVRERTTELELANKELIQASTSAAESFQIRRILLRRLVTAQEEERARLSRELHDELGQQLTALSLGLGTLKAQVPPDAAEHLSKLITLSKGISDQIHDVACFLLPTALADLGLCAALTNYVGQWTQWSGVPVDFECSGFKEQRLSFEIETTIYRIMQEALTNVMRHAPSATSVCSIVRRIDNLVIVIVEDNGPGFDVEATMNLPPTERRLGISGMQERAALAGGTLSIESRAGEGTTILMRLPAS